MQSARKFSPTSARPKRDQPGSPAPFAPSTDKIAALAAECRPGWSLPGEFYSDEAIYRADLDRIWRRGWLLPDIPARFRNPATTSR